MAGILLATLAAGACSSGSTTAAHGSTTVGSTPGGTGAPGSSCAGSTSPGSTSAADKLVPGDIPDNQAYVAFQPTAAGYQLSVPEGWARSEAGGVVTFTDKFNSIRVQVVPAPTAPSVASAGTTDVASLRASAPCFVAGKVSQVSRTAGPVILVTYRADSPPDAVTGKIVRQDVERYEFWRSGQEAIVTLSSSQGSDNVDPWRRVTDSFRWTP
jgi:hypothetical protein